jgi:hypothetical protein
MTRSYKKVNITIFGMFLLLMIHQNISPILNKTSYNEINYTNSINNEEQSYLNELLQKPKASTWDINGTRICNESGNQGFFKTHLDVDGNYIIVWQDIRNGNNDIYAQKFDNNGNILWQQGGVPVCTNSEIQNIPQITSDKVGGAYIAWKDERGANDDLYIARLDSNGNNCWDNNGTVLCGESGNQFDVELQPSENGVIATWIDTRPGANYAIYTQKISQSGNASWTPAGGIRVSGLGYTHNNLISCTDNSNGMIFAWEDERMGISNTSIYAQRLKSDGTILWAENGTLICNAGDNGNIDLVSDETGGAFLSFSSKRNGIDFDIYTQHVNSEGETQWDYNGLEICVQPADQKQPSIGYDSDKNLYLAWQDGRNLVDSDIYAQKINSMGKIVWAKNGNLVCNYNSFQSDAKLVISSTDKCIISWQDSRDSSDYDIYAQILDNSGNFLWQTNGTAIMNTNIATHSHISLSDGKNGLISIWYENRYGDNDIVATRLDPTPNSNHPVDLISDFNGTETINWSISSYTNSGTYRIWSNFSGNLETTANWMTWINSQTINVLINRTKPGNFIYMIEFMDTAESSGTNDSVLVNINDVKPTSNQPEDLTYHVAEKTPLSTQDTINWILSYNYSQGGGYEVFINGVLWAQQSSWINNSYISIPIKSSPIGKYHYTIEFYSITGLVSNDTVVVDIQQKLAPAPIPFYEEILNDYLVYIVAVMGILMLLLLLRISSVNGRLKNIQKDIGSGNSKNIKTKSDEKGTKVKEKKDSTKKQKK